MKKVALVFAATVSMFAAQAAYRIEGNVVGAENVMAYLARFEGMNPVNIDSAKFSDKGLVVFSNQKETLPGGLYMLRFTTDNPQQIEFLVSGAAKFEVNIFANTLNIEKSLKYSKSTENEGFKKYIDGQQRVGRRMQTLQQNYQQFQNNPDSIYSIQAQYASLMQEQKKQSDAIVAEYKGTFLATLLKAVQEPEVLQNINVPEGAANPDSIRQLLFVGLAKKHFFDSFDLTDARLMNAPMLDNRMGVFFQQIMLREPVEDINTSIDALLAKAEKTQPMYRYLLTWLYERYTDSPIEGHQVVGMHLCDLMSDSTKVTWLTDRDKAKLKQNYKKYQLNPVGAAATDLTLQTPEGEFKSLHKTNAPVTVLYFFNPGCGTCRMVTPVLHEVYQKYKEQGLEVFAVYPDRDTASWLKYIDTNSYTDWVNVWDAEGTASIYDKYSLHAIPQIYVLDQDKKVMYKDVYMNDLEGILYITFSQLSKPAEAHVHAQEEVAPQPQEPQEKEVKAKEKSKKAKKK
ncbi:MAG: redoxin domain-containing protein [Prevotellaceae bacterium]|nr:redoxin domain-containing protein [Prevotellaceae bacterium]